MHVYDHLEPGWHARYRAHGRQNGAATYSAEIVRYQVPIWAELAPEAVISTIPELYTIPDLPKSPLYVQYLHTLPDWRLIEAVSSRFRPVIFVLAYKKAVLELQNRGYRALWIPMTIDPVPLPARNIHYGPKRLIYFGNLIGPKQAAFAALRRVAQLRNLHIDTISSNRWNRTRPLALSEIHKVIARYHYGVGVGRCALEMLAMGLPTMIYGKANGGTMHSSADFAAQLAGNLNGDVHTGPIRLEWCLDRLPTSHVETSSVHDRLPDIRKRIAAVLG